jgi:hypothetical protein
MLHELPLWLPIWLYSAFGLALLAVFHHHHYHHRYHAWNHTHELIDEELSKQANIGTMRPSGSNASVVKKNAFRMGDFMLHTLPLAVKLWMFDVPSSVS